MANILIANFVERKLASTPDTLPELHVGDLVWAVDEHTGERYRLKVETIRGFYWCEDGITLTVRGYREPVAGDS